MRVFRQVVPLKCASFVDVFPGLVHEIVPENVICEFFPREVMIERGKYE